MRKITSQILLSCFVSLLLLVGEKGYGQGPDPQQKYYADSILFLLKDARPDTNRINLLNELNVYLHRIGYYDEMFKYATEAAELSKKFNFNKGLRAAYNKLAAVYGRRNNYDEALKYNFLVLDLARADGLKWVSFNYNEIGALYSQMGKDNLALEYYHKAQTNLQEYTRTTGIKKDGVATLAKNIGLIYEKFGQQDKALEQYHIALKYWQNNRNEMFDSIYICDSYGLIGNVLKDQGKYKEASKYFTDALIVAQKITRAVSMMTANRNLALLNSMHGNYSQTLQYFTDALVIAERKNMIPWLAQLNSDIGVFYTSQKNYDEALKHLEMAKGFAEKMSSKPMLGSVYINLANLYGNQNQFLKAIDYNTKAKKICEEFNNKEGLYTTNHNIGLLCYKEAEALEDSGRAQTAMQKLSEALQYQKEALAITRLTNIRLQEAHVQIAIGSILCKQSILGKMSKSKEQYNEGLQNLRNGLAIAQEYNDKALIKETYSAFYESYKGAGDYKNALHYSGLYIQANDSLLNDQNARKIEQIRVQYATDKAVNEERSKQENEIRELQFKFLLKEDSIKFQQKVMSMQFMQQAFISKQTEQELELKRASLDLANKQNELNRLNYLKSQAELEIEQTKREEKEQELTIANQEKSLQSTQLDLQQTQLNLKENQLQVERKQQLFYITGIALLVLLFAFIYRNIRSRQRTERLLAAERLKAEKANAAHTMAELELQSLRAQLNPHFMFNSLNAIQELILKEDNDNSHLYLSRFADLLRSLLDNANQPFVTLRKEMNLLELYLSLEKLRIPDLHYSIEIDPEIDTNKITIPNMMLQPYIENAIWHGLSHKKGEKNLFIKINKKGNGVICKVEDNGVGRKMSSELKSLYRKEHRSRGMELLSKRFILLSKEFGADIQTNIEDLHDEDIATGTRVAITLPPAFIEKAQPVYS